LFPVYIAPDDFISSWSLPACSVLVKDIMKVLVLLLVILSSSGHPIDDSGKSRIVVTSGGALQSARALTRAGQRSRDMVYCMLFLYNIIILINSVVV